MKHHEVRISKSKLCSVSVRHKEWIGGIGRWIEMELKIISDVGSPGSGMLNVERPLAKPLILYPKIGIIGLPNAGKSLGESGVSQHWTFQQNDEKAFQGRQHQAFYVC